MSYILDALRRADAERDRGGVPSLHTQQYGALPGDEDEPSQRSRLLVGAIVVLVLALASVLLRNFLGGSGADSAPTKTVAQAPVTASPPPPTPMPAPVAAPAPLPALPTASTPATIAPAGPIVRVPAKEAIVGPRPRTRDAVSSTPTRSAAKAASRREAAASSAAAATASSSERVYAMAELPEAIRRDLPRLAFGGSAYSNDAASRMVILNGQVFHEGDTVARGLVLQTVKRKSAVLSFNGYRYELAF